MCLDAVLQDDFEIYSDNHLRRVSIIAVFATYQSTILHINARQCSFLHLHINIAVSSLP